MAFWIGSLVQLGQTEVRISHSAFHLNNSLNLAEAAAEKSILALNTDTWSGWREVDGILVMEEPFDLGDRMNGSIRATIYDHDTNEPRVIAEGRILLPTLPDVTRRLEVFLEKRRPWENGFTLDNGVILKGEKITFDSYNSELGPYDAVNNRNANATVASPSVAAEDDFSIGNAKIYGYVAVGGGDPMLGPQGNVSDLDAPAGTVDQSRITRDFGAFFPAVPPPNGPFQYEGTIDDDRTLGYPGATTPTAYLVDAISFNNKTLTIAGPVVIYVVGGIGIGGNSGSLVVDENATAEIYAAGDVSIGGDGALNRTADPKNLMFFGTGTTDQNFKLHGGSDWVASIYAPNAHIELKGGGGTGTFFGAMVGEHLTVVGNYDLHYDESLSSLAAPFSTFRPRLWRELFAAGSGGADFQAKN